MDETSRITTRIDEGVATLLMNRPQAHNAFDETTIAAMTAALHDLDAKAEVSAVLLKGAGKSFSAGADLDWMRRMAQFTFEENLADARRLGELLRVLASLSKPTIALVEGDAYGGGVGLVAACDIAIATSNAGFALSEVRLGLIPATISPYVVAAMGERACHRYFLTGERFNADTALRLGLIHELVDSGGADAKAAEIVAQLKRCAPGAQASAKQLIAAIAGKPITAALIEDTAIRIARQRGSDEARDRIAAFLKPRAN